MTSYKRAMVLLNLGSTYSSFRRTFMDSFPDLEHV